MSQEVGPGRSLDIPARRSAGRGWETTSAGIGVARSPEVGTGTKSRRGGEKPNTPVAKEGGWVARMLVG